MPGFVCTRRDGGGLCLPRANLHGSGGALGRHHDFVSLFPGGIRFQKFTSGRFDSGQLQLPASEVDGLIAPMKEEA
jgi:hypothetical protein